MHSDVLNQSIRAFASREFTAFSREWTVAQALTQIRERGLGEQIIYFYVVDEAERLVGVVPTRRLLTARPTDRLSAIMVGRVVSIPDTATVLEACEQFVLHKFLAFPVLDVERRIVGVVNVGMFTENVLDLSEREHLHDVFQSIGVRVAEVQGASPLKAFRLRFPWLMATLCGGVCCAVLSGFYEATLATSIILAFFLTLVLGLSESVSAQSVTVTVESMRGRAVHREWFWAAVRKEFSTALMLGAACGAMVCGVAWMWRGQAIAALVIGGSIAISMVIACLIGLAVPAVLHRFKLDPRIAAGPLSLALADLCTLLVYFNTAKFVL